MESNSKSWRATGRSWLRWSLILGVMASAVGSAVALFLWSLDQVTQIRFESPVLLYFLPLAGAAVAKLYVWVGKSAEGGNNLILEQIHEPGGGVPRRMAPLILFATLVTHLFGGSAGREGTALQMGGSLASAVSRAFKLGAEQRRLLLMGGMAAGFGAVFGTPFAGAIFAIEVLVIGRLKHSALIPCLIAAWVGHWTCHAWGVSHAAYAITSTPPGKWLGEAFHVDGMLFAQVAVAAVAFGWVSVLFAELSHGVAWGLKKLCPSAPWRAALGGVLVLGLAWALGTTQYLGLSVSSPDSSHVTLASFFTSGEIHPWAWWWKILFTVLTLSSGFKGGEVTPLFFVGAALGNAMAGWLGAPLDLMAAVGFVAVFAAASNTPVACTILAVELFGWTYLPYFAVACWIAYLCSGKSTIYLSQRVAYRTHRGAASLMSVGAWRQRRKKDVNKESHPS